MKLPELFIFILPKFMISGVSCDWPLFNVILHSSTLDDGNLTMNASDPRPVFVKKIFALDPNILNKTIETGHPKGPKGPQIYRSYSPKAQTKGSKSTKKPKHGRKVSKLFRIVGGSSVSKGDMPWQAAIVMRPGGTSILCGGTLICPKFVITAQHCTTDPQMAEPDWIEVLLGVSEVTSTKNRKAFNVKKYHNHPKFEVIPTTTKDGKSTSYYKHDVALLELAKPWPKLKNIASIKAAYLPDPGDRKVIHKAGAKFVVSGWGKLKFEGEISNEQLMGVTVPFVPDQTCKKLFKKQNYKITSDMICAGGEAGKDSCQGDSGGPLTWLDSKTGHIKLLGVVSFGFKCAEKQPGVYGDLTNASILKWVNKITKKCNKKLCKPPPSKKCKKKPCPVPTHKRCADKSGLKRRTFLRYRSFLKG